MVNVSATTLSGDQVTYSVVQCEPPHSQSHTLETRFVHPGSPAPGGLNFSVGSLNGLVEASGTLDRETFSRHTIIVEVHTHTHTHTQMATKHYCS